MRKNVFGRQFKRTKNQRAALFRSLITSLFMHGKIQTTYEKAKSIKGEVDKIITNAKKGEMEAKRLLSPILPFDAIEKAIVVAKGFSKRNGGYTRIIKMGRRVSDSASIATIEFVEQEAISSESKIDNEKLKKSTKAKTIKKETKKTPRRNVKRSIKKNE